MIPPSRSILRGRGTRITQSGPMVTAMRNGEPVPTVALRDGLWMETNGSACPSALITWIGLRMIQKRKQQVELRSSIGEITQLLEATLQRTSSTYLGAVRQILQFR